MLMLVIYWISAIAQEDIWTHFFMPLKFQLMKKYQFLVLQMNKNLYSTFNLKVFIR